MTWSPVSEPVDFVVLGGKVTPGLASLEGWSRPYRWDERKGYGLGGAFVVYHGMALAKGKLVLRLYGAGDWDAWDDFRSILKPPERSTSISPYGPRPKALAIVHPLLEHLNVRAVVVQSVSGAEQTGDGEWTITIELIEFRRPTFNLAKPEGAQEQPADPADQTIAALTEIIANDGRGSVHDALANLGGL